MFCAEWKKRHGMFYLVCQKSHGMFLSRVSKMAWAALFPDVWSGSPLKAMVAGGYGAAVAVPVCDIILKIGTILCVCDFYYDMIF